MPDDDDLEMPAPPDLTALFDKHSQLQQEAREKAFDYFEVVKTRDADIDSMTSNLESEINQVFLIAKAVQNAPMAIASVPVVLTLANGTFAKVTELQARVPEILKFEGVDS